MSMIRHPAVYTATPLRSLLRLGKHFSYRLRDSGDQLGMAGLPPLVKTVVGSVSGSEYTDPTLYQFPNDNGNTNSVQWVAEEVEDDLYLDHVLTLVGMSVGEQIIVACDVAYVEQANTSGTLFSWGAVGSTHSGYAFNVSTAEAPQFVWRPRTGGTTNTQPLTLDSGDDFSAFKAQGRFSVVMSIRPRTASGSDQTIDVEMRIGNGTLGGVYSFAGINVLTGGTENPGISGGSGMDNFVGLSIGSQGVSVANTVFWGRGTATPNVGRFDVLHGWRGAYNADLAAAVLLEMHSTNALDYPPSLAAAV